MDQLNSLYLEMLQLGMLVVRQALSENDLDWAQAEIELLHNVPSLINEFDVKQHKYFWNSKRVAHIEWANEPGRENAKSRVETYYLPIWKKMEPLIERKENGDCAKKLGEGGR